MLQIISSNEALKRAAHFYARILGLTEGTVIITVIDNHEHLGVCDYFRAGNLAFIILETMEDPEDLFQTLAHEMVHAKQYIKGELNFDRYEEDIAEWNGTHYSISDELDEAYWFAPWEVEAYGMQVGLVEMYLRELEKSGSIH